MKSKLLILLVLLVFDLSLANAQVQDSLQVLTLKDFYHVILQNHPVASQASLLTDQAHQELRIARGSFDPVISSKFYQKEYNDKLYYSIWSNTFRIPTWFGPELIAGYDQTQGHFINPGDNTPDKGLSYAGISVPLGQGLLIDERRAIIKQANLMQGIAEAESVSIINKLLLQATKNYWDWLLQYRKIALYKEALELADFRLKAVRVRVQQGDLAAIDTVEAITAVQDRQVMLQQAQVSYNNARLVVTTYLWDPDHVPLELRENVIPALTGSELNPLSKDSLQQLLLIAKANHPVLRKLTLKGKQLEIEQNLSTNKLIPKLNAEYNVLQREFYLNSDVIEFPHLRGNYKIGLNFSMPIFLRHERGKLQLVKAKQQTNHLEIIQTLREVENNLLSAFNEWQALEEQIRLQEQMVNNANILRNGEFTRFQSGESSLFLVNAREVKLMEAQLKLYALRTKYAKAKTFLYWSAGNIEVN